MRRLWFCTAVFLALLPGVLLGSYLPDGLVTFINSRVSGGAVGSVSSVEQGFYVGKLSGSSNVVVGDEVVILSFKKGLPLEFLPISAVGRIDGVSGSLVKVTPLVVFAEVKPGDVISFPGKISLLVLPLEGVPRKDITAVTKELIGLKGVSVKEVYQGSLGDYKRQKGYFLLLRMSPDMEKGKLFINLSLESVYSGDIFFMAKVASSAKIQVPVPGQAPAPGQPPPPQPYPYQYQYPYTYGTHTPTVPSGRGLFSRKKSGYYMEYRLESLFSDDGTGGYRCVAAGDVDGDGDDEVVLLGKGDFLVLNYSGGSFVPFVHQPLPLGGIIPVNVDVADINGNGVAEVFATVMDVEWDQGLPKPKVLSYIYEWDGKAFNVLYGDINLYLRVIKDENGRPMLIAQQMGDYDLYEGHIMQIVWDGKNYTLQDPPPYMKGIKRIYGFCVLPGEKGRFVYVDDVGRVSIRDGVTWKKIKYYDTTIGMFDEIKIPIPLETPMATSKTDFIFWEPKYRERRVEFVPQLDYQIFTIDKGKVKSRVVRVFTQTTGEDDIIGFSLTGSSLDESWRSMPIRRYITDFAFGDPTGLRRTYLFILEVGEDGSAHLEAVR